MELIFIRHGQTPGNLLRLYVGSTDQPLAPEGEEQARKARPGLPPVDILYRSPMLRCAQTAAILFPGREAIPVEGLRETDFGDFEGHTFDELKNDPRYKAWLEGADPPNGEPRAANSRRCREAFLWILRDAETRGARRVAVVTHGGTIMELMAQFALPKKPFYEWLLQNCGSYRLKVTGDPPVLEVLP